MQKILKSTILCLGLASSLGAQAVNRSESGQGQVLLYPYYSVNNNLNTLYTVVNTRNEAKAIKLRFLEGEAGREVFEFNVYLSPHDVWYAGLVPTTSTIAGHVGEPSVLHVTPDTSCAPFLNTTGHEFLPYVIDIDAPNNNMQRARDGHIEVIEMGVVTDSSAVALTHVLGVPANCDQLENAWLGGGYWIIDSSTDMSAPTGGLTGGTSLINVADGIEFSYNAEALEAFWQGDGNHGEPGSLLPSLNSGSTESKVLLNNEVLTSQWSTGFEAVSAVLMQNVLFNEFDFSEFNDTKTEWVLTYPTKSFHTNGAQAVSPFSEVWDGSEACEFHDLTLYDQEEQSRLIEIGHIHPRPPAGTSLQSCFHSNVFQFLATNTTPNDPASRILGADNLASIFNFDDNFVTQNGMGTMYFQQVSQVMQPISGHSFLGLPVIGFQVQQFTNVNAQPGLIAQYGRLFRHKGITVNLPPIPTQL